jgi:drug/metabolite transporter (DMT)-like permease
VSAEETSVILTTEPLWALISSTILLHESVKPIGILGSIMIILACYLTQVKN